jgi:hypothetical protein
MDEQLKNIVDQYTLNPWQIGLISAGVSIITFLLTNYFKNIFENKLLQRNLETEHKFSQQKQIKEVLAKNKVHLLTACEDLNHRMWNLSNTYKEDWLNVKGDYQNDRWHYFHSFTYRILAVYGWIKKIQKEMIFLDTTIATKNDLEFIKFLRIFPQIFCDLTFLEGKDVTGRKQVDHFFKNIFGAFPDCLIKDDGIKSFTEYSSDLNSYKTQLQSLYSFLDGVNPEENRKRWDRLHLLNLTLIIFLNNYGYDFQQTDETKMKAAMSKPKVSAYLKNYLVLLKEYKLDENKEVVRLKKMAKDILDKQENEKAAANSKQA